MTEAEIVERCIKNDSVAQQHLYAKMADAMYAICLRYTKNQEDAADVLQDAFIKVFQKIHQYKGENQLGGWIKRVVVNTALIHLRSNKKMQFSSEIDEQIGLASDDVSAMDQMAADELMELLAKLPNGYRTVFNMYAIEGYAHKEIAKELGVTENTSKTQYHKAKLALRQLVELQQTQS